VAGSILTSLGILKYRTERLVARTLRDLSSAGRYSDVSKVGYRQLFAANVQEIKSKMVARKGFDESQRLVESRMVVDYFVG
jgi:hypothetical protein